MIITLTLNPAFDIHAALDEFYAGHENLADRVTRDIGGKGINISRALCENNIENEALVVLGSENAEEFRAGLRREGLSFTDITKPGRIRENITVHPSNAKETRLSFKGFECAPSLLGEIEEKLGDVSGKIVTFTGSLPSGISSEDAESFLIGLKNRGALLVIDSKSISLEALLRIKPWLIKPNDEELEAYFGKLDEAGMIETAKNLHNDGIFYVLISLGDKGSIFVSDEGVFKAVPPRIAAVSTIGAGDSMIAGFIAAASLGMDDESRLRLGSAFGTAACLREGTKPPLSDDISRLSVQIDITTL